MEDGAFSSVDFHLRNAAHSSPLSTVSTALCIIVSFFLNTLFSFSLLLPLTGSEVFPVSWRAANENVEDAHTPTGCVQVLIKSFSITCLFSITCSIGLLA